MFLEYVGAVLRLYNYESELAWNLSFTMQDAQVRHGYEMEDARQYVQAMDRYHPLWNEMALSLIHIMLGDA